MLGLLPRVGEEDSVDIQTDSVKKWSQRWWLGDDETFGIKWKGYGLEPSVMEDLNGSVAHWVWDGIRIGFSPLDRFWRIRTGHATTTVSIDEWKRTEEIACRLNEEALTEPGRQAGR